jgi:hypothetical protein
MTPDQATSVTIARQAIEITVLRDALDQANSEIVALRAANQSLNEDFTAVTDAMLIPPTEPLPAP